MAKELPYFKFEPSEWQNGNIQMCSFEAKSIFIDICCSYWQRLGNLPYAFALQRHCNRNKELMQELENADVLQVKGKALVIKFLDEQMEELGEKSAKARKSAQKRWSSERNANASKTQSDRNAIRREEKREEEIRKEDDDVYLAIATLKSIYLADEKILASLLSQKTFRSKEDLSTRLEAFNQHLTSIGQHSKTWKDYTAHFLSWHKKKNIKVISDPFKNMAY